MSILHQYYLAEEADQEVAGQEGQAKHFKIVTTSPGASAPTQSAHVALLLPKLLLEHQRTTVLELLKTFYNELLYNHDIRFAAETAVRAIAKSGTRGYCM